MDNELNAKMLKFAGFKPIRGLCYTVVYPDGTEGGIPDFTTDLNACEKWIFPILKEMKYEITLRFNPADMVEWSVNLFAGQKPYKDTGDIFANPLATAICLAVEKLMEAK